MHKTPKLAQLGTPRRAQARPGAHRHAQARARLAVSWAGPAVSWPGPQVVSQRSERSARSFRLPAARPPARVRRASPRACLRQCACRPTRPSAHACAPQHPRLRLLRAQCAPAPTACAPPGHIVAWLGTVSQYSPALPLLHSRNTPQCIAIQLQPLPSHNTVNCIVIQFSLLQPFCHNTLDCIAIQSKPTQQPLLQYTPVYCNTNSTLQAYFSSIQYSVLQYNFHYSFSSPLSCNTIARLAIQKKKKNFSQYNLGSSPKTVLHIKFFFFIISSSWKITKIYIYLFFFFILHNTQINF